MCLLQSNHWYLLFLQLKKLRKISLHKHYGPDYIIRKQNCPHK